MTTSRQPWTIEGKNLKSADGKSVALFIDHRDAELVLECMQAQQKLEEAQDKLAEVQNVLNGEY